MLAERGILLTTPRKSSPKIPTHVFALGRNLSKDPQAEFPDLVLPSYQHLWLRTVQQLAKRSSPIVATSSGLSDFTDEYIRLVTTCSAN